MGTPPTAPATRYEIRVEGRLDDRWADWLDGVEVTHDAEGGSRLRADLPDQSALHGVLARLRDLGIPVVSVCRIDPDGATSTLMRAVIQTRYGDPTFPPSTTELSAPSPAPSPFPGEGRGEGSAPPRSGQLLQVRQVDRPAIGPGEVLIRVHAAGLDAGVWHLVSGQPYLLRLMGFGLRRPTNPTPGMDVAGTVEAVGPGVTRFIPGDEVYGNAQGAFAEFARASESQLASKPARLTFEQAAATPNSAAAALTALHEVGHVRAGERVLVLGASGGVGSFAVQIAKAAGAHVTGVASTAKLDFVRSLGADDVVDYTREDFTGRSPYDLVLDIAGNNPLSRLRSVLTEDGRLVIVGGEGGGKWFGGIDRQLRAAVLSRFVRHTLRFFMSRVDADTLEVITALIDAGDVTPALDRTFALEDTTDALRALRAGQLRGKAVITP